MRLFLAIEIPEEIKQDIFKELASLQREYPYFRWTPPENYHITIHFFGNVSSAERYQHSIDELTYAIPPFYMYSSKAKLFMRENLTIFLQFQRVKLLESLVKALRKKYNVPSNRKFTPHISFARAKIPSKQQYLLLKKKLKKLNIDAKFNVESFVLLESILGTEKPFYKTITEFSLTDNC